jgi:response regulator RpfG family c-di-GMP phosphodiesterase
LNEKRQHLKVPLISVVDDDRSVVEAMVSLIQSIGYQAKGFRSAEDFLKSRQLLNTACLILDVRMPSMGASNYSAGWLLGITESRLFSSLHMIVTMSISKRCKLVLQDFWANPSARNLSSKPCAPPWGSNKAFNKKVKQGSTD